MFEEKKMNDKLNGKDLYGLYLVLVLDALNSFKGDVWALSENFDGLAEKLLTVSVCNYNPHSIFVNAMKLFAPELYDNNVSINQNRKNLEKYLKKHFFGRKYRIENGKIIFV